MHGGCPVFSGQHETVLHLLPYIGCNLQEAAGENDVCDEVDDAECLHDGVCQRQQEITGGVNLRYGIECVREEEHIQHRHEAYDAAEHQQADNLALE